MPAIYLLRGSPHGSSILPSIAYRESPRTDSPRTMVYMNLQPPDGTARRSPVCWWSLTHAFSPLPHTGRRAAVVFFCLLLLSPIASSFGSGASCAARTFLLHDSACRRQSRDSAFKAQSYTKRNKFQNKINFLLILRGRIIISWFRRCVAIYHLNIPTND